MAVSRSDANWLEAQPNGAAAASMCCRIVFNECMGARSNSLDASMSSLGWKPAAAAQYSGAWKHSCFWAGSLTFFFLTGRPDYIVLRAMKHATIRTTSASVGGNNRNRSRKLLHRSRLLGLHGGEGKPNWRHQQHKYGPAALVRTTASSSSKSSSYE